MGAQGSKEQNSHHEFMHQHLHQMQSPNFGHRYFDQHNVHLHPQQPNLNLLSQTTQISNLIGSGSSGSPVHHLYSANNGTITVNNIQSSASSSHQSSSIHPLTTLSISSPLPSTTFAYQQQNANSGDQFQQTQILGIQSQSSNNNNCQSSSLRSAQTTKSSSTTSSSNSSNNNHHHPHHHHSHSHKSHRAQQQSQHLFAFPTPETNGLFFHDNQIVS